VGSTVIGLASTAPVYSLVATLGFVVLAVGAQAPIAFIIAFVPMLFTAFAYRELNNKIPDCGTTFTWGTKAFGPWVGWMGGWGVAIAGMVVLANLAQIGSIYFWALFGMELENNDWRIILVAVLFIASMTWVSWRGVEIGERIQNVLLGVQYLASRSSSSRRCGSSSRATPRSHPFDWNWLNPFAFTDYHGFTEAVLLALFIYWGWDSCLALNEETKDPKRIPGARRC
jgi:amino acid transporter